MITILRNPHKYQFAAEVHTTDSKTAKTDNAIDAAILVYGMLINRDANTAIRRIEGSRIGLSRLGRVAATKIDGVLPHTPVESKAPS